MNESTDSKYRLYRNFNEFCKNIDTPEELIEWFKMTKHPFSKSNNSKRITWPDGIVRGTPSICFDHAFMIYHFCKRKGLNAKIIHLGGSYKNHRDWIAGHVMTIFKRDKFWYVIDVQGSRSEDSYISKTTATDPHQILRILIQKGNDAGEYVDCFATFYLQRDIEMLNEYWNKKSNINENELIKQMYSTRNLIDRREKEIKFFGFDFKIPTIVRFIANNALSHPINALMSLKDYYFERN